MFSSKLKSNDVLVQQLIVAKGTTPCRRSVPGEPCGKRSFEDAINIYLLTKLYF
ncbi:hypothetical protein JMA_21000 [Jeotgalibacillus malaysiensis]|uniref:Uncharacterized protein n=1 Tax=Jeotgalibacillus malaysiensis TaxID=1508404 RepID=A0A0B5ARX5_9BACL|nr:hypothetical protein JMA_21000 [Jeotgalibacillus malaysiensis]